MGPFLIGFAKLSYICLASPVQPERGSSRTRATCSDKNRAAGLGDMGGYAQQPVWIRYIQIAGSEIPHQRPEREVLFCVT